MNRCYLVESSGYRKIFTVKFDFSNDELNQIESVIKFLRSSDDSDICNSWGALVGLADIIENNG